MTKLGTLKVKFQYQGIERPKTFCRIMNEVGEVIAETSVKKSKDDVEDKLLGRFNAFRKAMNQIAIRNLAPKQQRVEAWSSFRETVKLPKSVNLVR